MAAPRTTTRRRLLKAGVVGGALAGLGSIVAVVRTRGYDVSPERAKALVALAPWQLVVVEHLARRIAAPDAPGSAPTPDDVDVAGFVDGYVAKMDPALRRDLVRCFGYVEHVAPIGCGFLSRFTHLGPADQDKVLAAMEASDSELLRAGFEGLKALVFMGYYRDARTWRVLAYDGPLKGRPEGGWAP